MALRLLAGVSHDSADDGPDLLRAVVDTGHFLGHPHTRANFRKELHFPGKAIDRATYGEWEANGALDSHDMAAAEVQRILARGNTQPLDPAVAGELDALMAAECRRLGIDPLPSV